MGALRLRHLQRVASPALLEPATESCPGAGGASQLVPGEPLGVLDRVSRRVLVPGPRDRALRAARDASPFSCAGTGPCLGTGAASGERMPSHASARAWHCDQGPPCDPGFRGLFPGGGKRDRLAGVGDREAWIGSDASGRLGAGGHSSRLAPRPQHRHTQALRGFGHGAPAAQKFGRKTGQLRQHPSTAGGHS